MRLPACVRERELTQVVVDPQWETADVDVENNHYPRRIVPSRIELYKAPDREGLEDALLRRLGVAAGDEWETLIAFVLAE